LNARCPSSRTGCGVAESGGGETCQRDIAQLGLEVEDALAVLLSATVQSVHQFEADEDFPDRTVVVMKRMPVAGFTVYVKVSMRLEKDHDVLLISFHR
jgi:menaquinone-dependent protoporphyrinogen IX oxidase